MKWDRQLQEHLINNTDGDIPEELYPEISNRISNMPKDVKSGYTYTYGAGSHAEVFSINQALLANPTVKSTDLITHVVRSGKKLKPSNQIYIYLMEMGIYIIVAWESPHMHPFT